MSDFVLDASVSLAWFVDRPTPQAAAEAREMLLQGRKALVPDFWVLEMTNGFVMAERRGFLTPQETAESCEVLEGLVSSCVEVAAGDPLQRVKSLANSARSHTLTVYDAAYLDLAANKGIPLCSLDPKLRAAATRAGISLIV
jgi:predicted nucleic acid-binding protein